MQNYLAFFHFGKTGKFDVTFPQFPGCVSQGDDFADAQRMAAEALALHVEGMREDDEKIPPSIEAMTQSHLGKFYEDSREADGGSLLPVSIPLLPPPGKSVRIQVTIDSRLLSRIDAVTNNRSGFLADAAADRLGLS